MHIAQESNTCQENNFRKVSGSEYVIPRYTQHMTPGHSASVTGGALSRAREELLTVPSFTEQFPRKKPSFSLNTFTGAQWLATKYGEGVAWNGAYLLLSDDLLKRVSSWYEATNIFSNPPFSLKLSDFRRIASAMANNQRKDKKTAKRAAWKGFLDFRLDDDQLQELDEWQPNAAEIFDCVDGIMLAGFRLTLSYNSLTKLSNCTIIDDRSDQLSGGFALSTADTSCALALKAAVFKHSLVLQGDWSSLLDKPSQGGRRG